MSKISLLGRLLSPVTCAFVMISLLIIIIVILVWPPATWAILSILGAMPPLLNALAAFIVTLRSKPVRTASGKEGR